MLSEVSPKLLPIFSYSAIAAGQIVFQFVTFTYEDHRLSADSAVEGVLPQCFSKIFQGLSTEQFARRNSVAASWPAPEQVGPTSVILGSLV